MVFSMATTVNLLMFLPLNDLKVVCCRDELLSPASRSNPPGIVAPAEFPAGIAVCRCWKRTGDGNMPRGYNKAFGLRPHLNTRGASIGLADMLLD